MSTVLTMTVVQHSLTWIMDLSEYISSMVRWILDMLSCRSINRRCDLMDDKCHMGFY